MRNNFQLKMFVQQNCKPLQASKIALLIYSQFPLFINLITANADVATPRATLVRETETSSYFSSQHDTKLFSYTCHRGESKDFVYTNH
jgi:hypothetical protein